MCGADGGFLVNGIERDGLGFTAAMDVGAEFLALRDAAYGGDDTVTDDKGAHILAFAFGNEFLEQDLLFGGVQGFDDGFRDLDLVRQNHPHALGAF